MLARAGKPYEGKDYQGQQHSLGEDVGRMKPDTRRGRVAFFAKAGD